jgi:chemotaxis protein CheY-P-specific phosphatase CheC
LREVGADVLREPEIDRLSELANIGAGRAAGAFARLAGRTIRMQVPRISASDETLPVAAGGDAWRTGVFFEFEGHLDALVGILFRASSTEKLVRRMIGDDSGPLPAHHLESALMEVGNILASHVASAIADTEGVRLLPSIPTLAMEDAESMLASMLTAREGDHPIRIECELTADEGELGGLLVLIPRLGGV